MITEQQVIGKIEVLESGVVQVRTDTVVARDGVEICRTYHRHVLNPGDTVDGQDACVAAVAQAAWAVADAIAAKANT